MKKKLTGNLLKCLFAVAAVASIISCNSPSLRSGETETINESEAEIMEDEAEILREGNTDIFAEDEGSGSATEPRFRQEGLECLQQELQQNRNSNSYEAVAQALSCLPENTPLEFPGAGKQSPANNNGTSVDAPVIFEGYITENGQAENFSSTELAKLALACPTIVSNANSGEGGSKKVPVIDVVVRNSRDAKRYIVPRVSVQGVCRDAVNAVLKDTIKKAKVLEQSYESLPTS